MDICCRHNFCSTCTYANRRIAFLELNDKAIVCTSVKVCSQPWGPIGDIPGGKGAKPHTNIKIVYCFDATKA